MSSPIRLGLIGCGGIVQKSHLQGLLDIPDLATISAIADPIPENRNRVGTATDIISEQRYEDHRHMLARAELDAVIIATPHHLHAEHVIEAAQAGVAIISEKPMATSLEEADQLLDAVKTHNIPYAIVHNFLYTPGTAEALRLLRRGKHGHTPNGPRPLPLWQNRRPGRPQQCLARIQSSRRRLHWRQRLPRNLSHRNHDRLTRALCRSPRTDQILRL